MKYLGASFPLMPVHETVGAVCVWRYTALFTVDPTLLGAVITALATVIAAIIAVRLQAHKRRPRFTVRMIEGEDDPDLSESLELLQRDDRIPPNERDDAEITSRWLREVRIETAQGRARLRDYFLVVKLGDEVCGSLYGHYYLGSRFFFCSYLLVGRESAADARRDHAARDELLRFLRRELRTSLKQCRGVVFELESPRQEDTEARARLTLLKAASRRVLDIPVKAIQCDYVQPKLSLDGGYIERPLTLMYGRTKGEPLDGCKSIPRDEAAQVLAFVYDEIYGDAFEGGEPTANWAYRAYLKGLRDQIIGRLPTNVAVA